MKPFVLVFQLRCNRAKLARLNDYLTKRNILKDRQKLFDDEPYEFDPELEMDVADKPWKRRQCVSYSHINVVYLVETKAPGAHQV